MERRKGLIVKQLLNGIASIAESGKGLKKIPEVAQVNEENIEKYIETGKLEIQRNQKQLGSYHILL